MKKKIILISLVILLSGCTKIDSNNNDYKQLVDNCLDNKIITNNVALGYKFYTPKGIKLIKNYDYNQIFLVDDVKIYLYVDIISYYYKKNYDKVSYNDSYFKKFNYNNKFGYIYVKQINEKNYFIEIYYNYSKVEFYAKENNLNKLITLSTIILNNVKYNDKVIKNVLDSEGSISNKVTYHLDKPEESGSNFSQYLEEYVQTDDKEEENKLPDE